ncbi:hypothetical protein [Deinococcus peraridilitoris]|uniref:Uncharacterized protein n=1 Tax=Deinococcus peraridilitoris (strain DSM 19664 / LMG 22246 / CIP 109416 / KR-200) TaxID=937777 RepID=K9ZZT9_DEIPD|nr:hypothetical protein [Deinococcus peraridilitoris]AFZ66714.1 hypothetical protein Deipe_1155 [Deinococcus peraridilitoris DSM 19664]
MTHNIEELNKEWRGRYVAYTDALLLRGLDACGVWFDWRNEDGQLRFVSIGADGELLVARPLWRGAPPAGVVGEVLRKTGHALSLDEVLAG